MAFPEVCIVDRETCANNLPVIKFYQYTNGIQEVILKDDCGEPVDLSEYDFACFLARDSYGMDPLYLNVKAELTDNNRLKIQLKDCQLTRAGIFLAEFVLFKSKSAPLDDSSESGSFYNCSNSSGFPQDLEVWGRYPAYLMVAESLAENRVRSNGLTIAEIRYGYYWVNGVMAELLKAAARNYSRNNLRYQGGGISINDKDKAQEYMAFGRELEAQYDDWIESTKLALNASQAWGTTFIPAFGYICGANNIQGIAAAANPVIGPLNQGGRIPEPNCCD
jgi:hypothetical protein